MFVHGDSHAEATLPGLIRAVGGRMSIRHFFKGGCGVGPSQYGQGNMMLDVMLDMLRREVRRGDVVAIVQLAGQSTEIDDYLERELVDPILKPRGAKLLRLSDNPALSAQPSTCSRQLSRCHLVHTPGSTPAREAQMDAFAAKHPGTVYGFAQSGLWRDSAGAAVPNTRFSAFREVTSGNTHLSYLGAFYLAPYLCGAFERWGFFGGEPAAGFPAVFRAGRDHG